MKNLAQKTSAKLTAYILFVLISAFAALSVMGIAYMWENDVYISSLDGEKMNVYENFMAPYAGDALSGWLTDGGNGAKAALPEGVGIVISDEAGGRLFTYGEEQGYEIGYVRYSHVLPSGDIVVSSYPAEYYSVNQTQENTYNVRLVLSQEAFETGKIHRMSILVDLVYGFLRFSYWIAAISAAAELVLFIFLMYSAGKGPEGVRRGKLSRFPLDIAALCALSAEAIVINILFEITSAFPVMVALATIMTACILLAFLCLFAAQLRAGSWWSATFIHRCWEKIFLPVLRAVKKIFPFLRDALRCIIVNLPLIWKTVISLAVISFAEFFALLITGCEAEAVVLWMLEKLIVVPFVIYLALALRRLQKGGRLLAAGVIDNKISDKYLVLDLKEHCENLNSIGEGMNRALGERLKSERLKTELITNVGHDIKTPLTSIINYSDLICRENCENGKIKEYSEVLHRQSVRLKKLLEDLIEASKASTGNIDITKEVFDLGVMLSQTAGEYNQRLEEKGLELVLSRPDEQVTVMADSRHMGRIIDNLMSNICKYSLRGTRVYISLELEDGRAKLCFRNISEAPINMAADELLERFKRGDSSRSTEGSGLGLSIARSLTELQGGEFELITDGDLFKVVISFGCLNLK